jgi:hypothetical protein
MKKTSPLLIAAAIAAILIFIIGFMYIGASNKEIALRNQIKAKQAANKASFDTVWKVIAGKASVTEKERESFRTTFIDIMNARTGNDKNLMWKWAHEAQIPINNDLWKDLSVAIESQREGFKQDQQMLLDLNREHDNMIDTFPSSLFVGQRGKITVQIVTSTKTEQTFQTGKEENADPFAK